MLSPLPFLAAGGLADLPVISLLAATFTAAWVLGIITQKLGLSPIVGYLLAGVVVGPFTPGFRGDAHLALQFAELGVILLMFGVGLHFNLKDLLAVKNVAIPGALVQSLFATILGGLVAVAFGMTFKSGLVLGMAMAVASTVVLMRVLSDAKLMDTSAGHVAVGWLIVEDILTVIVLVLIPALAVPAATAATTVPPEATSLWITLPWAVFKLALMVALLLVVGARVIPRIMVKVAVLRSQELFTLTVLVMAIAVSAGAFYVFGASMALGAFLAGMVVAQSPVSSKAAADALPFRDAFAVLFFASVGMLLDPTFVLRQPLFVLACLAIILVGKPLAALAIVAIIGYPAKTAIVVAIGLAQIGEFSFIVAQLARSVNILSADAHNALVTCAIISITLNPLLFKSRDAVERLLQKMPPLWRLLNRNAAKRERETNADSAHQLEGAAEPLAVILGYGPVGRTLDALLIDCGMKTLIVDLNIHTIQVLHKQGRLAIYGDAFNIETLIHALPTATLLVITLPHATNRTPLIASAKLINPHLKIFVRAHYLAERDELEQAGADLAAYEEAEVAVALAKLVLTQQGKDLETQKEKTSLIRQTLQGHL